jgi:hypothetical protein
MPLISVSSAYSAPKRRPKRYKASDAAYEVGGNNGYYIAALPRPYPKNEPQKKIAALADTCKIKKGMKKKELQETMKDCVTTENYKKVKV